MDGETPRLLSTLSSHSASLKSCTFLDTSRSSVPFENAVATAGRDGNILIFDVRGPDKMITDDHTLTVDAVPTQGRTRGGYSAGVPGFEPQFSDGTNFWKFRMANAHGDSPRKKNQIRSVTSLVALQSMPGYLASAGSADG
jgi:denticleless